MKLESWNPFAKKRKDIWCADLLVLQGSLGMAIQTTDSTNHSTRVKKALNSPDTANWLRMGIAFYVYSWMTGSKKDAPRITQLVLDKKGKVVLL